VDLIRDNAIAKSKSWKEINAQCTSYMDVVYLYVRIQCCSSLLRTKSEYAGCRYPREIYLPSKVPWKEKLTRTRIKRRVHSRGRTYPNQKGKNKFHDVTGRLLVEREGFIHDKSKAEPWNSHNLGQPNRGKVPHMDSHLQTSYVVF
jgi:hypothetical protein